jgi:hypothetical protein
MSVRTSGTDELPGSAQPAPGPVPTAPVRPAPVSTAPVRPAPVSTAPVSTAPVSTAPVSTASASTASVNPALVSTGQAGAAQVAAQPEQSSRAWRILGIAAVCLGLAALAGATFVLSYSAIRAVALDAGITPRLARGYPVLVDAMLVIVLAAVLALRGAGLPSKVLAWLTLLVVLAAAAGADALHAAGQTLPHQPAAITAAALPWVLVFVAFVLLLAMLRHARLRRLASARHSVAPHGPARAHWQPAGSQHGQVRTGAMVPTLELPSRPAAPAGTAPDGTAVDTTASDGTAPDGTAPDNTIAPRAGADTDEAAADAIDSPGDSEQGKEDHPDMPVFHRMWSAPTPPGN